jgi:hypothetical protein
MRNSDKPLFLPILGGKGYTKREVELLRELGAEIKVLADGSYTINGETHEEIETKYKQSIKELQEWAKSGPVEQPAAFVRKKKATGEK